MAFCSHESLTISQAATIPAPPGLLTRMQHLFDVWTERRRGRATFARMSERDIEDTGIARWEIERELARPFWRD
ncbi:DUF1127 domain-containing protein [Rhodopila sp.]|jgi:uncharacterized protein YjiS (DUF1127 family)|uniref:DUF1127 domain-containing protein n=1 Tax=Rhodopila sp. TaxID=2480087 RepID=UPI002BF3BC52|nr:hypothetical protein [Rhodopila sp.]HVZ09159.1 hypothetical protein [Rhodopila sp.]